jgi:hypothetical protein
VQLKSGTYIEYVYLGVEGFIKSTYSYANKYTPVQMGSPQSINTSYIYVQRSREEKKKFSL